MEPTTTYWRPLSEDDWEQLRPLLVRLYIEENRPLSQVMKILEDQHQVRASAKMYKNKIKAWKLLKYLKEDVARQVVNGKLPPEDVAHVLAVTGEPKEVVKRAVRAVKRKLAYKRAQRHRSPTERLQPASLPLPSPTMDAVFASTPSPELVPILPGLRVIGVQQQFLFNLRAWTHDAFFRGHLEPKLSTLYHGGRQVSRMLSSDLTAGSNLYDRGKLQLAWTYWNRALARINNPDLFKTWYHETPIRLLFEASRIAQNGHFQLAAILLRSIKDFAHTFLDEKDSRYALFSVFGDLDVAQLKELYARAAQCMYKGLESRLEKNNPLLYEVRLNRALDMLWYDPGSDLTEWLPPIVEVDQACGPNSPYSVYFLLLQAYRLVAQELYCEADLVCSQVHKRLTMMEEGNVDSWRVGLAYRRLGRQQQFKGRYVDARRSLNTALKYIGIDTALSASIWIEICQCQESMANALDDQEDAVLWNQMLQRLEEQTRDQKEVNMSEQRRLVPSNDAFPGSRRGRLMPGHSQSLTL